MSLDDAIRAAADAVRSLSDADLLELALAARRSNGSNSVPVEAAKSASRPTEALRAQQSRQSAGSNAQRIVDLLKMGPATWRDLQQIVPATGSLSRVLQMLTATNQILVTGERRMRRYQLTRPSPNGESPSASSSTGPETSRAKS
jgi:hypothetical protein